MLIKNPYIYFEAWELQTCGWWATNCPRIHAFGNIAGGVPRNITATGEETLEGLGIEACNLLQADEARSFFSIDGWFVPISWINWFMLFLIICLVISKRKGEILGLIPSVGIVLTFIVASPIWYWPRYGLIEQILLPVFVLLLGSLSSSSFIQRRESKSIE